jgi:ABC-type polysaccharide/polyol phosphate transport system ATPase subunit
MVFEMSQPCIEVKDITKRYRLGTGLSSIRDLFSWDNIRKNGNEEKFYWALKGLSFDVKPGESLGIIGPNGAGKTTTLKLLSRVTRPTSGDIVMNGRFSALIELGAGFHPDLTGRENVYLNATILGMSRKEVNERFDDIVSFSGIGNYLDTPVKRYSSGMFARLGFAIAAHVDPEILLVDEVLAVGDYAFQQKCYAKMDDLRKNGTSLIFVSHNMEVVRRVCDNAIVMYAGEKIFEGPSAEAVIAYSDAVRRAARKTHNSSEVDGKRIEGGLSQRVMTFDAEIKRVYLEDDDGNEVTAVDSGEAVDVVVETEFKKDIEEPIFSMFIRQPNGQRVYDTTTRWMDVSTGSFQAGKTYKARFRVSLPLLNGEYELGADVATSNFSHYYDRVERALSFYVVHRGQQKGIVDLGAQVSFAPIEEKQLVESA